MRELYVDEQLGQLDVANRLGFSTKVVQNIMDRHDIPTRPSASDRSKAGIGHPNKLQPADVDAIVARYQAGESAPAIAASYDVAPASIYHALDRQGITERHGNRSLGQPQDHARGLKDRLADLGVTSRQVKDWAITTGLLERITVGLPARQLVDAYATAHSTTSTTNPAGATA